MAPPLRPFALACVVAMQPIAYFAVRSILGWLQFVERGDRAFASSPVLLVATGAAHCWAVVYALFIAIHTRAMRFDGYHEGYTEHLPFWVSSTETLAVASMGVWWAAGFLTAAIRIIDDDAQELPVDGRDVNVGFFMRLIRSSRLHDALFIAHTLSCVGLFASIILLCIAMALMKGAVTLCEVCLCLVSIGFALPHAVVAHRLLRVASPKKEDDVVVEPLPAAEAAAQEAAALGPQFCLILALADSPGHAYLWQNVTYLISTMAFLAAIAACGHAPPKAGKAAIPPEPFEFCVCLFLDLAASVALVICFPHLNTWHMWALAALLVGLFAAVWFEVWREVIVDLLDPLMVVRSDTDKLFPGRQRESLRNTNRVATTICAAVALWDILLHPLPEGMFEPPPEHTDDLGLPDLWDQNTMLLFRWQADEVEAPGEQSLLANIAETLETEPALVTTQVFDPTHRMLLFKAMDSAGRSPAHVRWKEFMFAPKGSLAAVVDNSFPASLNVTLCLHATHHDEHAKSENKEPEMPADFLKAVGPARDAQQAYLAGCHWWTRALDAYYGHEHEEAVPDADGDPPEVSEGDEDGSDEELRPEEIEPLSD